jgi:hypothetical protein
VQGAKMDSNGTWKNIFSNDENAILERPVDQEEVTEHMNFHIDRDLKRIVFAHQKDNQGRLKYRFKGEYEIMFNNHL